MKHISDKILNELKGKLVEERERLLTALKSFGVQDSHNQDNFDATFVNEGDDLDASVSESTQYSEKLALTEQLEQELLEVERALEKMSNGTYGLDEHTQQPIDVKRLQVFPAARTNV